MKYIFVVCATLLLAGCEHEVYRYSCQDPANWDSAECKKPICEVSRTCPEQIFKNQNIVMKAVTVNPAPGSLTPKVKGECQ